MKITKYDHLTVKELLDTAYAELTDEDELALALMIRLAEVHDELETTKEDYETELTHEFGRYNKLDEAFIELKHAYARFMDRSGSGDVEGVPV